MPVDIKEFHSNLMQEIYERSEEYNESEENIFFEIVTSPLMTTGELTTADQCPFSSRGINIDGYGGDPKESDGVLTLLMCDFDQSDTIGSLTATAMNQNFRRMSNFVNSSLKTEFREGLADTNKEIHGLTNLINSSWKDLAGIKLVILTNRRLSRLIDNRPDAAIDGVPVTHSLWDLDRLHRWELTNGEREEMVIDLEEPDFIPLGGPISALAVPGEEGYYTAYMTVIPAAELAAIYTRWRQRLLEQNVRLFLQARGNVNRGIRDTLTNEPGMFFAYNNGITATAEQVETRTSEDGLIITRLTNFQIVNGGQTTVSIVNASKDPNVNLTKVHVQMKLAVVEPTKALAIVPKISKFANSQNKVQDSDFFSNHPFHVWFEVRSSMIDPPASGNSLRGVRWYYERARGQFLEYRANMTAAQRNDFDSQLGGKRRLITKTDLAKFLNVWLGKPDIVCKGAQNNMKDFAAYIDKEWGKERDPYKFNSVFYKEAIAKALIFHQVETIITNRPWYAGGYRAQVVAHTISKLAYEISSRAMHLDFQHIWDLQRVSPELEDILIYIADSVHLIIENPSGPTSNISEWAKRPQCWGAVQHLDMEFPFPLEKLCLTEAEYKEIFVAAADNPEDLQGQEEEEDLTRLHSIGLTDGDFDPLPEYDSPVFADEVIRIDPNWRRRR